MKWDTKLSDFHHENEIKTDAKTKISPYIQT